MKSGEHAGPLRAHSLTQAHKLVCMLPMCLHALAHFSAKLVGSERWRYLWSQENIPDLCEYVFACMGLYLSQIWMDQRDQSFYGIRRTGLTFLSTYFKLSMQASMHACCVFACTGPYLSRIEMDLRDQCIYWIRISCRTSLSAYFPPEYGS